MSTTLEHLIRARSLIQKPEAFCLGYFAADKNFSPISPLDKRASSWNLVGALLATDQQDNSIAFTLFKPNGDKTLDQHKQALAKLSKIIETLENRIAGRTPSHQ